MVRRPVILDYFCVNMEILFFFFNIIHFRFVIYVTAIVLICYENKPFGHLTVMILHIFALRGSAHLYLICCIPKTLYDFTFHLSTWKLSEQNCATTFKIIALSAEREEKFIVILT